ncbi:unnamed protein product [Paramecium pentaurelia]|uniref:PH domain-containing protein n=1 Tax=Paramecium pentaurelia TaxID=43138 RepID=A0A8S1XW75_9CILI|nr:unnamed protein product [Paramecium pentaurelia]
MQQNNFQAKFKAALAISKLDKKNRAQNKGQTQNQLHQTIVEHNGLKSTYFMGHNEIPEIDENAIVVAELDISIVTKKGEQYKTPKLEGMLLKKSPHYLQGWQQRWAVCQDNRLVYYLPENRGSPFGVLDFNIMSYSLQDTKDQNGNIIEFVLIPSGSTKNFIFKAGTSQETMKWFHVVRENKDTSEGAKKILNNLVKYPRFWRTDRISCEQFLKTGDTGDILLFRGNGANCLIQRGLTGSDYDHAAVLLRFPSGSLYILEATGCYGVGLCSWKDMIDEKWFELYEKIMIRKLEIERDHTFLKTVQEFVNENMGKKYSLTPMKLLKQKSTVQDINKQVNKEERTFFCSELVAALYKQLGIFDQQKSAAQYWPGSLCSENKQLVVLKGILHPEQLIDFSSF